MREIVLDTETTGLDVTEGHRLIEIGACEMINHVLTNKTFHVYINPEREIDIDAVNIHGISNEDLIEKPKFSEICDEFLEFIGTSPLVIHNADFDISFINNELNLSGKNFEIRNPIIDTLKLAKKKFPGSLVNLDSLCKRFDINLNSRKFHGALIDAVLLSDVYVELIGGKQTSLTFDDKQIVGSSDKTASVFSEKVELIKDRNFVVTESELEKHKKFIETIDDTIWKKYL